MAAPDFVEPLIGWRAWHVIDTPDGLRLHSVGRDVAWEPGAPHTATCRRRRAWWRRRDRIDLHGAPHADCSCGVWAVPDAATALTAIDICGRSWKPIHRIVGRVSLWGRVVEYERGWRAQYAYPAELIVPARRLHGPPVPRLDAIRDDLGAYGIPVTVVDAGARGALLSEIDGRGVLAGL